MKININQIPPEGLEIQEDILPGGLDLETQVVKLRGPVKIRGRAFKITNAVSIDLSVSATAGVPCSRCLNEVEWDLSRDLQLHYHIEKSQREIDLGPQIREELMLEYPLKPLCKPDCRGLCPKFGRNLNEGKCDCTP